MWRLAVLVSALTVVPSLTLAQQPCTTDAGQVIEQVYRQVLERSADPGASGWVDRFDQAHHGSRNRSWHRQVARTSAAVGSQSRDNMVVDVYRHLLNREPEPEGMKNAGIFVSMRGFASLVDQLVDSPEYRERFGDWTVPGSNVRFASLGIRAASRPAAVSRAAAIVPATARRTKHSTTTASITSTSTATDTSTATSGMAARMPSSGST